MTLVEKYNIFIENNNINEFIDYYYSHNDDDVIKYFNLSHGLFRLIKEKHSLKKTKEQTSEIAKKTWANKETSKENKLKYYINNISKQELEDYYITQNHYVDATLAYFNIPYDYFNKLIKYYNLVKDNSLNAELVKQTKLDRYGNSNYNNRDKAKETCLEKYGVDNPFKDIENITQSYINSFGYDHPMHNPEIKAKVRSKMDYVSIQEKVKKTCLDRYGVDNAFKATYVKGKIAQTNYKRYGAYSAVQNESIKLKIKNTINQRYGNRELITEKIKATKLSRYNDCTYSNRLKAEQSYLRHYGVTNPMRSPEVKANLNKTNQERYGVDWFCLRKECRAGNSKNNSKPNLTFAKLLDSASIKYEREFNIHNYCYDFKIGNKLIEIDPFATHNSTWGIFGNPIPKDYHYNKSKLAEESGYQCLHIFDWEDCNKVIRLLQNRKTIYGRKCILKEVSLEETKEYLNKYHLQGYAKDKIRLGLYYNNELVSLMTFGKPRYNKNYEYELIRYCSHYNVIGGAEKIFKHFMQEYKVGSIISYCDNSKFTGSVYSKLGFTKISEGNPSRHWYNSKTKQHITDNLLRQRGFDQLFGTSFGKGYNNDDLMLQAGFVEIYDCGQSTWIYKTSNL